jgi:hypothetical protein
LGAGSNQLPTDYEPVGRGRCARPRDESRIADRHTARADASRCFAGDCLTHKGLGVGTEMPLDGDGTMVGDKITTALAP